MQKFIQDLKSNAVALISLVVAIAALLYTGWREERTEKNRTIRVAAFEVLKNLGELQVVVNESYYQKVDPMVGWGHIALIGDLGQLIPAPVPETVDHLVEVWKRDWSQIKTDDESVDRMTQEIDASRQAISELLYKLR